MPRKRRLTREESKARTRFELLRAASRLFLRNGFVATSLADIAEEAALTKGAVYSNFTSKEDLFLALLQELANPEKDWINQDSMAPADLSAAVGDTAEERAASWGRAVTTLRPSKREVALFLEMNAVAMRNERTRAWVAKHNAAFFERLGSQLAEVLDAPDADPEVLGLIAQSIYVGLTMHGTFTDKAPDPELYAKAYSLLARLAQQEASEPV